jgi:hypothetical protein
MLIMPVEMEVAGETSPGGTMKEVSFQVLSFSTLSTEASACAGFSGWGGGVMGDDTDAPGSGVGDETDSRSGAGSDFRMIGPAWG